MFRFYNGKTGLRTLIPLPYKTTKSILLLTLKLAEMRSDKFILSQSITAIERLQNSDKISKDCERQIDWNLLELCVLMLKSAKKIITQETTTKK